MPNKYRWIDLSYLESVSGEDREIMEELITIFLDQIPEFNEDLDKNFREKRWRKIAAIAHKAKSSVLAMGMEELGNEDLKNLELLAKQMRVREITDNNLSTPEERAEKDQLEKNLKSYPIERQDWILNNTSEAAISKLISKFGDICTEASKELQSEIEK